MELERDVFQGEGMLLIETKAFTWLLVISLQQMLKENSRTYKDFSDKLTKTSR